jgi:hypothetical protein
MDGAVIAAAVAEWFRLHVDDPQIRSQLALCTIGDLEVTSVGFFAQLDSSAKDASPDRSQRAYTGCGLFAPELEIFAHCILHTFDGRVSSLELLAVGSGHPLKVSSFELREVEENVIDLRGNDA